MRILSTLRPTNHQLIILAKITASKDFPARAAAEISTDQHFVTARNELMKLNLITYAPNKATLTPQGEQLAKDQNIIDEMGELTELGNNLLGNNSQQPQQTQQPPMGGMGDLGSPPMENPPMEGFSSLFKKILIEVNKI